MKPQKTTYDIPDKRHVFAHSVARIALAVAAVIVVMVGLLWIYLLFNPLRIGSETGLFTKGYSDNPLNNEKDKFRQILQLAVDDASVGWMREKTVDATGCVISTWGGESCSFDAFLRYWNNTDARKVAKQLESRGWQSFIDDYITDSSTGLISQHKNTIDGVKVEVIVSHNKEDGSYYANISLPDFE